MRSAISDLMIKVQSREFASFEDALNYCGTLEESERIIDFDGMTVYGQTEIADAITGLVRTAGGSIWLDGKEITSESIRARMQAGISYIPEDRQNTGVVMDFLLGENLALRRYYKNPYASGGILNFDEVRRNAAALIDRYDNLLLVQTFSKSRSLAGLRIGYAMGCPDLIKAMCDVKYSFNSYTMNRPSILLGKASIEDEDYFRKTVDRIIATRTWFARELQELGFHFPESRANFIFASHESIPAKSIFTAARDAGIYVRYFEKPRIDHYLRITIGTDEEMRKLLQFLKTFIENAK